MREEDIYKNPVPLDREKYLDPLKTPLDKGITFNPISKNNGVDPYIISNLNSNLKLKEMEARKQLGELIARLDEMKIEDKTKPQVYTVLLLLGESISKFGLDISSLSLKFEIDLFLNHDYKFRPKEEFIIINKDKNEFLNIIETEFSLLKEIRVLESQVGVKIVILWGLIDQIRKGYMTLSGLVIQQIGDNISKMASELSFLANDLKSKKDLLEKIEQNPFKKFIVE